MKNAQFVKRSGAGRSLRDHDPANTDGYVDKKDAKAKLEADIETLCKRVMVIDHGRLLFDGALNELRDRILPVTSILFDVKRAPDPSQLSFLGLTAREVGLHRYRLDLDRRTTAPATAVKEIVNRFEVSDLTIEEPEVEEVVKRIYQEGIS